MVDIDEQRQASVEDKRLAASKMPEAGRTLVEIGAALGVSRERARQYLLPPAIRTNKRESMQREWRKIVNLVAAGKSRDEIGDVMGMSRATVVRRFALQGTTFTAVQKLAPMGVLK